jgi:hypothetical protein
MRNRPIQVDRFRGGETSRHGLHGMSPGMSHLLENCYNTENETVRKVPGYIHRYATNNDYCQSAYEFIKLDGTVLRMASYADSTTGYGWYDWNGTLHGGGGVTWTVSDFPPSYATMIDSCWMVTTELSTLFRYSGIGSIAFYTPTGFPTAPFKLHVHKNRMWCLDKDNRLQAKFSALGDPLDWSTPSDAGFLDLQTVIGDGDEILEMATFVNYLVFFMRNYIVIYSGSDPTGSGDFSLVQVIESSGVLSTDLVQPVGSDLWYVSKDGAKSLRQVITTGAVNVNDVSERIDSSFVPEVKAGSRRGTAHYFARKWVCFIVDDTIWVYDYGNKAWFHILTKMPDSVGGNPEHYGLISPSDGTLWIFGKYGFMELDHGNVWDYGLAENGSIEMVWNTANIIIAAKGNYAFPAMLELHVNPVTVESGTILVSWEFDHNGQIFNYPHAIDVQQSTGVLDIDAVTDWDAIDPFDGFLQEHIYVPLEGEGKTMDFTIRHNYPADVEFEAFVIERVEGGM